MKYPKNMTDEIRAKMTYNGVGGRRPKTIKDKNDPTKKAKLTRDHTPRYRMDRTGERSSHGMNAKIKIEPIIAIAPHN